MIMSDFRANFTSKAKKLPFPPFLPSPLSKKRQLKSLLSPSSQGSYFLKKRPVLLVPASSKSADSSTLLPSSLTYKKRKARKLASTFEKPLEEKLENWVKFEKVLKWLSRHKIHVKEHKNPVNIYESTYKYVFQGRRFSEAQLLYLANQLRTQQKKRPFLVDEITH